MGKTQAKVPSPEPKIEKSLNMRKVFTQNTHLPPKSSEEVRKRLMTASSPIHAAHSKARPKIKIDVLENLSSLEELLKSSVRRVNERRRLEMPILDAEKRSPRIITMVQNPMKSVFPSIEDNRWRQPE